MSKLSVCCPEGWTYITWQRIVCTVDGKLANRKVEEALRQQQEVTWGEPDEPWLIASKDGDSLFILSGESATLEDLAETIAELLEIEDYEAITKGNTGGN